MHVLGFTEIFTVALSVSDSPIIMLCNALQNVLDDPSFCTKSQEVVNARMGTGYMHIWCSNPDNLPTLQKFSEDLLQDLERVLINPNGKILQQDKVWETYFYIRS